MKFHPWRLPLAAFTLAVLSALWLWRQIFAHEGVRERISSSAIPASFTLYYCLLAAGVFTGLKRDSSDLRFRRIVPMMTVVALSTTVPWWSGLLDSVLFLVIYSAVPAVLVFQAVLGGLRKLASPSSASPSSPSPGKVLRRFASRILHPGVLLVAGSLLVFISTLPATHSSFADSLFLQPWITSSSIVNSWQWEPAVLLRDYAGRAGFVLSIGLALGTVWLTAIRLWKRQPLGQLKLAPYLVLLSALLCAYTQIDAFYAFQGLLDVAGRTVLYTFWLATAAAFLLSVLASRLQTQALDRQVAACLLLLGFPVLAHVCMWLPLFVWEGDQAGRTATNYMGVAVLAWGWLKASASTFFLDNWR